MLAGRAEVALVTLPGEPGRLGGKTMTGVQSWCPGRGGQGQSLRQQDQDPPQHLGWRLGTEHELGSWTRYLCA